jgi:plasmid stabilization system protein ParE
MALQVHFLKSAEQDLKDLKAYIIKNWGKTAWQNSYGNIKAAIANIQDFPQHGKVPEELAAVHLGQYRQVLSGMNRIIYEMRQSTIFIHIICDTRRDLVPILHQRLIRSAN